jgi:hypothetical protein
MQFCYPRVQMHPETEEFGLYLKGQLAREPLLALESHLAACESCVRAMVEQDRYLWCLAEVSGSELTFDGEKRRYPRVATDEAASVQVLAPFQIETWDVRIVDVSKGGVRILTPRPLQPESLIRVKMRFSVSCGDVRHCSAAPGGFHAGVRLHDYFLASSAGR